MAKHITETLLGAMAQLQVGNPALLATDVGPVIDADARALIQRHIERMRANGRRVHQPADALDAASTHGCFVPPTLIELDSLAEFEREIFGPVLHLVRYQRQALDALREQIRATGYGLTLGVHTRIDETLQRVLSQAHVGNVYVNRNMVGAVVGVQAFGGEGLSGTGPKAGGPLYLYRLLAQRLNDVLTSALGAAEAPDRTPHGPAALQALHAQLPAAVQACVTWTPDWTAASTVFDAVLLHGGAQAAHEVCARLAERAGPIVALQCLAPGKGSVHLDRLMVERVLSVNTAAAGGNARLMTLG